jgi:hypothetical protein
MIIIQADDLTEAQDLAAVLSGHLYWPYKIMLDGTEFRPSAGVPRDQKRKVMLDILAAAGPRGLGVRKLRTMLFRGDVELSEATVYRWLHQEAAAGRVVHENHGLWRALPGLTS